MVGKDTQPAHRNTAAGNDTEHAAAQGTAAADAGKLQGFSLMRSSMINRQLYKLGHRQLGTKPNSYKWTTMLRSTSNITFWLMPTFLNKSVDGLGICTLQFLSQGL